MRSVINISLICAVLIALIVVGRTDQAITVCLFAIFSALLMIKEKMP